MNINISRKFAIVMESLFNGNKIDIGQDYPIAMAENFSVGAFYNEGVVDDIGVGCLMRIISKMPEENIVLIAASNALTKESVR